MRKKSFAKFDSVASKTILQTADKSMSALGKWAITDHTGISQSLINMPSMGFIDTCKYIVTMILISVAGAIGTGLMIYLLICYGIPYFVFGFIP